MSQSAKDFKRDGMWFKDSDDRFILFRGINIASRAKLPPYLPTLPLEVIKLDSEGIKKFTDELEQLQSEFDRIKESGFNLVRFLVIWKAIEPEPSANPEVLSDEGLTYLELVKKIIDNLYSRGIYVIIDFHQDLAHEKFGGDGFPDWVVNLDEFTNKISSFQKLMIWQLKYFFNLGVISTLTNFWQNKPIQYKNSIYYPQDHLAKTIGATARFFQSTCDGKGHPGILGYEFFNEPISLYMDFMQFEKEILPKFYQKVQNEIQRSVGIEKGDQTAFLFMEPRSDWLQHQDMEHDVGELDSLTDWEWQLDLSSFSDDNRAVYSFHYYDFSLFLSQIDFNVESKRKKYMEVLKHYKTKAYDGGGIPFLTEFGASNDWQNNFNDLSPYDDLVHAVMDLQYNAIEHNLLNSTYWNYDFYFTEKEKDNWNQENFSLLGLDRQERNLDIASRPYPMYSSSKPIFLNFDLFSKHCVMKFRGTPIEAPTVIYIPKYRHYPDGFEIHATSEDMEWDDKNQILNWKQNKEFDEHLLIICPLDNFDENLLSESNETLEKLRKFSFN